MKRNHTRAAVLLAWLAMLAWLVRYEAFPERFARMSTGYARLFSRDVLLMDTWMRVTFKGAPIGYSHSSIEIDEDNPRFRHLARNRMNIRLKIMGMEQRIAVDSEARLDDAYRLQAFLFNLSATDYRLRLSAERGEGNDFTVRIVTDASEQTTTVNIPDDVVLYSPMTEMAMKRLKPGQSLSFRTLDPTTMDTATMTVKALRHEPLDVGGGHTVDATLLTTDYRGIEALSWIDENGMLLRQETPFGWTLEKCTIDEAFAALSGAAQTEDLLLGMAVPVRGVILQPRGTSELRLRLSGVLFEDGELETNRQRVEERDEASLVLRVRAAAPLDAEAPDRGAAEPPADFTQPTLTLQSDHPEIQARARAVAGDLPTPAARALAIYRWVHANVRKETTISLPSALDVLRTLRGDCNEHTYLFVALARAAGVPAKIVVGLAYHEGAFYYHAWPAVFVHGDWHEMDPTWGQPSVDATHIAVAEGELGDQLALARLMGQLKIESLPLD